MKKRREPRQRTVDQVTKARKPRPGSWDLGKVLQYLQIDPENPVDRGKLRKACEQGDPHAISWALMYPIGEHAHDIRRPPLSMSESELIPVPLWLLNATTDHLVKTVRGEPPKRGRRLSMVARRSHDRSDLFKFILVLAERHAGTPWEHVYDLVAACPSNPAGESLGTPLSIKLAYRRVKRQISSEPWRYSTDSVDIIEALIGHFSRRTKLPGSTRRHKPS